MSLFLTLSSWTARIRLQNKVPTMRTLSCLLSLTLLNLTSQSPTILDLPDHSSHPEPCALTCSGISRSDDPESAWYDRGYVSKATKIVDISGCKFAAPPVVTAVVGRGDNLCTSIHVRWVRADKFYAISVEDGKAAALTHGLCDVYWIATGYSC